MDTSLIIIGFISLIGCFYLSFHLTSDECKYNRSSCLFLYSFCFMIAISVVDETLQNVDKTPNAMDVYRGKTELKITKTLQNDSIVVKCDSLVVFKE